MVSQHFKNVFLVYPHPVGSQNSVHQVSSLASSQQDKDEQKQGDHHDGQVTPEVVSRPVYSSNIEELQSQKETVVQEESQEETVPATRENLLPYSSIPGIVTGTYALCNAKPSSIISRLTIFNTV